MDHEGAYKILLVDNDLNCLDAVGQILKREGYEILPISDGYEAVKVITENRINLAIVDFDLVDTDGIQILYEIRKMRRNIPVVIMTAEPSNERRLASLQAGAYSFVSKPINIPSFRQIVAKAIEAPKLRTVEVERSLTFTRWIRWIIHR